MFIPKNLVSLFKISLLYLILSTLSCTQAPQSSQLAFYHWQTNLDITDFEKEYLQKCGVKKLYVKFFDVDWDGQQTVPKALLKVAPKHLDSLQIIPCVFITNRTLQNIEEKALADLAKNIHIKLVELNYGLPNNTIEEIQIDCDWSVSTKTTYFRFLDELKLLLTSDVRLSATIRLHQIKFFAQTGVPPVDRGMLMYYNMGDLDDLDTENSILDTDLAKAYLYNFDAYPLELDIALPIFAWAVLLRDAKVIKLINNLRQEDLTNDQRFQQVEINLFEVQQSTYFDGYYLYQGDFIRTEAVPLATLQAAVAQVKPLIETQNMTVALYHLDSLTLSNYGVEDLKSIWD